MSQWFRHRNWLQLSANCSRKSQPCSETNFPSLRTHWRVDVHRARHVLRDVLATQSVMMGEFQQFNINDQDHCNGWPHKRSSFQGSFQQVDDVCYAVCAIDVTCCVAHTMQMRFTVFSVRISYFFFLLWKYYVNDWNLRANVEFLTAVCHVLSIESWIFFHMPSPCITEQSTSIYYQVLFNLLKQNAYRPHGSRPKYTTDVVPLWDVGIAECHLNGNETNGDILKFKLRNDFYFSFSLFSIST